MIATIRLESNQVHSINISQVDEEQEAGKIQFNYDVFFSAENSKEFAISFNTTVTTELVVLEVNFVSYFVTEDEITEDEHGSKFITMNAPAIGYPFLRAYVANLMLSSGYPVYMMPTINFTALAKEKEKRSKKLEKRAKKLKVEPKVKQKKKAPK